METLNWSGVPPLLTQDVSNPTTGQKYEASPYEIIRVNSRKFVDNYL